MRRVVTVVAAAAVLAALAAGAHALFSDMSIDRGDSFMKSYGTYLFRARHPRAEYLSSTLMSATENARTYRIDFRGVYTGRKYTMDVTLEYSGGTLSGISYGRDTCPVNPERTVGFLGKLWRRRGVMMVADLANMLPLLEKPAEVQRLKVNDMTINKAGGAFKYKKESPSDAQQRWKLAGSCPTAMTSLDEMSSISFSGRLAGGSDQPVQTFYTTPTGVKGRKGNRYKQKFFYFTKGASSRSSGHHSYPSFGMFKAWLEDGELRYLYSISKANQGGVMIAEDQIPYVKDYMETNKTESDTVAFETAMQVNTYTRGAELHDGGASFTYKANTKKARGKLEKNPPAR
ncbi:hypothetical protein GX586_13630 [bacterium]|nr:hypothetical protein [bacterium]